MTQHEILLDPSIHIVNIVGEHINLYVNPARDGFHVRRWDNAVKGFVEEPFTVKPDHVLAVYERRLPPFTFRYEGGDVIDELFWRCPETGSTFHLERMANNSYWFCLQSGNSEVHINIGTKRELVKAIVQEVHVTSPEEQTSHQHAS